MRATTNKQFARRLAWSAWLGAVLWWAGGSVEVAQAESKPRRIVSINLCTDQILIDLVPRERIAALSYVARDPSVSAIARQIEGMRLTHGNAEDVLSLNPDLIIAGAFTTPATVSLLKRLGKNVVVVPLAGNFNAIGSAVRLIANAVGENERGERLMNEFNKRLEKVRNSTRGIKPSAVFYQVSSLAATKGGLSHEAITAAGLTNLADGMKLGNSGYLPLEKLVMSPPDLIVLGHKRDAYRTVMAANLRHPAFVQLIARSAVVEIPQALLLCGMPRSIEVVERLAKARQRLIEKRTR